MDPLIKRTQAACGYIDENAFVFKAIKRDALKETVQEHAKNR